MCETVIKAVIFDLGRVLIDIDLTQGILSCIEGYDSEAISIFAENEDFVAYSTGRIGPEKFFYNIRDYFNLQIDYVEFETLWCNIFFEIRGMKELVASLAEHYPLGLLSDTDPLHWKYILKNFPWINCFFNNPVLSFDIGVLKPHLSAFEHAVAVVGVKPEECIFIDDLQKNIEGANRFGINGILFKGKEKLLEDLSNFGIQI